MPNLLGVRVLTQPLRGLAAGSLLFVATASGCSDDDFIATNEVPNYDGSAAGGAGASGTDSGAAGSAGESAGGAESDAGCTPGATLEVGTCEKCGVMLRTCDASGQYGAPVCEDQGVCEAGLDEESAPCGNCGTQKRTCQSDCTWGAFGTCSGEGACKPGAVDTNCVTAGKLDPCLRKECGDNCQWGSCKLKPGAVCAWEAGTNFKCCGADMWQYCSPSSCDWYPCASCNGCSAC